MKLFAAQKLLCFLCGSPTVERDYERDAMRNSRGKVTALPCQCVERGHRFDAHVTCFLSHPTPIEVLGVNEK